MKTVSTTGQSLEVKREINLKTLEVSRKAISVGQRINGRGGFNFVINSIVLTDDDFVGDDINVRNENGEEIRICSYTLGNYKFL